MTLDKDGLQVMLSIHGSVFCLPAVREKNFKEYPIWDTDGWVYLAQEGNFYSCGQKDGLSIDQLWEELQELEMHTAEPPGRIEAKDRFILTY